jgi:hypothetical protein
VPCIITDPSQPLYHVHNNWFLWSQHIFAPPFFFNLNQFTNDFKEISIAVEEAIIAGFLKPGNILVMDNAGCNSCFWGE